MARGADGSLGPIRGALKKRLRSVDELNQDLFPQCFFDEFDPLLDSADMSLEKSTELQLTFWFSCFGAFNLQVHRLC